MKSLSKFRKKSRLLLICTTLLCIAVACSSDYSFTKFYSFTNAEWEEDNSILFELNSLDSLTSYDISLEVRNNNDYPFQNLWLFIQQTSPSGVVTTDSINIELADIYGEWHGKGINLYSYEVPYQSNVQFPESGTYTLSIRHGMRTDTLSGITDLGLLIKK